MEHAQGNIDLGVLQETKVTDGVHTHASADYRVLTTDAPTRHIREVVVFYQDDAYHFQVKAMQHHRPNVMSFQVASGGRCWFIVG